MKVAVFGTKPYDRTYLTSANTKGYDLNFLEPRLTRETSSLAEGHDAVCVFVNDILDRPVITHLHQLGIRLVALRCAGFNNVDLAACAEFGIKVVRVPAYSPHAVAEHTVALLLALNRRIHRAYNRVREGNFALEGLLGFDLVHKTVGVIGTGKIGETVIGILKGFGCTVLAHDPYPRESLGVKYVDLDTIYAASHVITLHLPLSADSYHLIDAEAIAKMREGVTIINTSRGGLLDTQAVIDGLKSGRIGRLGLDVYEEEGPPSFEDRSHGLLQDDVFARLLTFPNVLITGHQAFFTEEALIQIAEVTLGNIEAFTHGEIRNEVHA